MTRKITTTPAPGADGSLFDPFAFFAMRKHTRLSSGFSFTLAALALGAAPLLSAAPLAVDGDTVKLDEFGVRGSRPEAYTAAHADSSTKLPISIFENPQNIQVVPRSLLADQGALKLDDVLKNVAGVTPGGYYSNWDYYRIRGFDAAFNTFIDGLRHHSGMGEELFGLEQVEIVKGPAGTLFGQGPLGGVVNLVSKRPRTERGGELGVGFGTDNSREVTLDYTTPLDANGRVLARLTGLWRDEDLFIDYAGGRSYYLAPSLTWKLSDATSLTILTRYRERDDDHAMPLPASGTVLPNPNGKIPLTRFNGEPGRTNHVEETTQSGGYEFVHRLNDRLTLRQNLNSSDGQQTWGYILYPGSLAADGRTLSRYGYSYDQGWRTLSIDTRLEGKFTTGTVEHSAVAGVDFYRDNYSYTGATIDFSDPAGYTSIDLYAPVYGGALPPLTVKLAGATLGEMWGYYAQDHLKLGRGVALTLGGRYDTSKSNDVKIDDFTPRAGLSWEFRPGAMLYATYSGSFNPQGSWQTTATGTPVDPETGTNYEIGLKTAAADGRLTATISLFELTRQNVATADLAHPGYYVVTGEQRSRGVEFDGRFSPRPGWELALAYAYTDARITADNSLPVGARTPAAPLHGFNVWTKYVVPHGALKGFGAGVGLHYYSRQLGDSTYVPGHEFDLPAYGLVDAALYYSRGRFRAQLNVSNALDREYYSGAYDPLYVLPGTPRQIRVSTTWKF